MYEDPLTKKSTANQRKEHNFRKYIQWITTPSLTIRVATVGFQICEILQNFERIRTYSR